MDGLRAPFVIHRTKEVHTYDDEFTVVLGDWYHADHSTLLKRFMSIGNPGGAEPVPGMYTSRFPSISFPKLFRICLDLLRPK